MKARENPFRVDRLEALPFRFDDDSLDNLLARWEQAGFQGAIVGPHGSGKSTLLEEIAMRLRFRGEAPRQLRLTEENLACQAGLLKQWLSDAGPNAILLLDGFEQISTLTGRALGRKWHSNRRLLATSHHPRPLPTLYSCRTSPALLAALVHQLTGTAPDQNQQQLLCELYEKCRGNLRNCLRELYDRPEKILSPVDASRTLPQMGDQGRGSRCQESRNPGSGKQSEKERNHSPGIRRPRAPTPGRPVSPS